MFFVILLRITICFDVVAPEAATSHSEVFCDVDGGVVRGLRVREELLLCGLTDGDAELAQQLRRRSSLASPLSCSCWSELVRRLRRNRLLLKYTHANLESPFGFRCVLAVFWYILDVF